jgi:hypothetical protein
MDTSDYVVKKAIFRIEPWRFQYYHEWKHGNQNLFMKVFVSVASTNANSARDNRDEYCSGVQNYRLGRKRNLRP